MKWLRIICVALALSSLGCASWHRARNTALLSDARQIVSTRYMLMTETGDIPSFADIIATHPLLDEERLGPFEKTAAWRLPEAREEVVLQQRRAVRGYRVVATAAGSAQLQEVRTP